MAASELPQLKSLDLELKDGWLTVWFNEPERRNPLTSTRVGDILTLCEWLQPNRAVRGITFRGRGGVFCSGGDLAGFKAAISGSSPKQSIIDLSRHGAILFETVNQLPQVVVMALEGSVMAGGLGLACTGDVVIAQKEVKFAFTETRLGIPPAQIAPFVLARLGHRHGRRLMLTGETIAGADAHAVGLVDQLVDDKWQLEEAVCSIKMSVLKAGPRAVAATKNLIHTLPVLERENQVEAAAQTFADCLLSLEGQEGVSSFLEKRPPNWADGEK